MTNAGGTVTLLFTDLVGSTELLQQIGDDAAEAVRRTHFRLLREAVAAGAGEEVKSLGDGLMVVFASTVDALGCAVAMQQAVHRHNQEAGSRPLRVRVGLHVGEPIHDEHDYFGTPVVVARRLCDNAQGGQILVSDLVHGLVGSRGQFRFRSVGALHLKGLVAPLAACEVLWHVAEVPLLPLPPVLTMGERTPFVGRAADAERLRQCWERTRTGERQLVLVAGEPGIGKTRLTAEFAHEAHARGATVLYGRCYEEALTAYQPFVETLRHYVTACHSETLQTRSVASLAELARLVPELAQRVPSLPPPVRGDPENERYRLFEAVTTFLIDTSRHNPVLLLLDDLHWADKQTLVLLKHIARSALQAPLLIVGAYREVDLARPCPLAETLADLRRECQVERITLKGLDESDTATLITALAGHETPRSFMRAVYDQTEGNPFFIEEVLRHLAEAGGVSPQSAGGRLERSREPLGIPEGVREVICRRLSHLSPECRSVIAIAAVVGREFSLAVLERVTDVVADRLSVVLEEAVAARILNEVPQTVGRYSFAHTLIRETLYEELTATRRVQLHRRIGRALEQLSASNPELYLAELAYHFFAAAQGDGDADKALDYAVRAAARATTLLAYEEAVSHYERALQTLALQAPADEVRRGELVLALAEALNRAGDRATAKETFLQAAELARRLCAPEQLARAALGFEPFVWAGVIDAVQIGLLEEAKSALDNADSALRARVLGRLAVALYWTDVMSRREALSQEAVRIARRSNDPATLAYVLLCRHLAIWSPDNVEERLATATEIVRLAEQAGDIEMAVQGHQWRLVDLLDLGDVAAVDVEIAALTQLANELRQPRQLWFVANARTMRALLDGRFDEAEQLAQQALALGQPLQDETVTQAFGVQLFMVQRQRGQLQDLEAGFQGLVAQYPAVPAWRCGLAYLYSQLGRVADAQRELDCLAAADFTDLPKDYLFLMAAASLLAPVCNVLGDTTRAAQLYALLLPYAGRYVVLYSTIVCGSVARYLVLLATTLGRWDDATRHFQQAIAMDSRMGARPWVAHDQHEYAVMLVARGRPQDREAALTLLDQAIASAQALGMTVLVEQASALKGVVQSRAPATPPAQRDLRLLAFELGCAFAERQELEALIPFVTAKCREVLDAEGASILLIDRARHEFYFPSAAGEDSTVGKRLRGIRFAVDRGIAGAVALTGKSVRVDDVAADPRFYDGVDRVTGEITRSLLAAPLRVRQETIGVLEVVNRHGSAAFNDDDLALLEALAGGVAVAIDNARPANP